MKTRCQKSELHVFFISNHVAKGLTLKMVEKLSDLLSKLLVNLLSNVKNANAKKFGWTLLKIFYFFNVKFTQAKFPHTFIWHNLIVCSNI